MEPEVLEKMNINTTDINIIKDLYKKKAILKIKETSKFQKVLILGFRQDCYPYYLIYT